MKRDLKLIWTMIKSGLMFKMMVIFSVVFVAIGIMFEIYQIVSPDKLVNIGDIYLIFPAIYINQIVSSNQVSALFLTAPDRKKIETRLSVFLTFFILVVGYLISAVFKYLGYIKNPLDVNTCGSLVFTGLFGLLMEVYVGFVYKNYVLGMFFLPIILVPFVAFSGAEKLILLIFDKGLGFGVSFALGFLAILVGMGLNMLLTRLCYKRKLDPLAFRNALTKNAK